MQDLDIMAGDKIEFLTDSWWGIPGKQWKVTSAEWYNYPSTAVSLKLEERDYLTVVSRNDIKKVD
jgi:hypothetical protein